jgi:hypothetical protein
VWLYALWFAALCRNSSYHLHAVRSVTSLYNWMTLV